MNDASILLVLYLYIAKTTAHSDPKLKAALEYLSGPATGQYYETVIEHLNKILKG